MPFVKYRNPAQECSFPFENHTLGYCWSYALFVDGHKKLDCSNCEFYILNGISNRELQYRFIYSIIVAGKSAKFTEAVMKKLLDNSLTPFGLIRTWEKQGVLEQKLREAKTGNYNKIYKSLTEFMNSETNLRTCSPEDLEKIHGIGPKTARFFIMWTRPNVRYAALDTHILKWLGLKGYTVPKSTPNGKRYKDLEQAFLKEADVLGISPQELDTKIWTEYSGYNN